MPAPEHRMNCYDNVKIYNTMDGKLAVSYIFKFPPGKNLITCTRIYLFQKIGSSHTQVFAWILEIAFFTTDNLESSPVDEYLTHMSVEVLQRKKQKVNIYKTG